MKEKEALSGPKRAPGAAQTGPFARLWGFAAPHKGAMRSRSPSPSSASRADSPLTLPRLPWQRPCSAACGTSPSTSAGAQLPLSARWRKRGSWAGPRSSPIAPRSRFSQKCGVPWRESSTACRSDTCWKPRRASSRPRSWSEPSSWRSRSRTSCPKFPPT